MTEVTWRTIHPDRDGDTMPTRTSGETREKLLALKQKARGRSHDRRSNEFRKDEQTESDLALASFDDGWDAGYRAGFQQALDSVQNVITEAIKAQRSGIMAHPNG